MKEDDEPTRNQDEADAKGDAVGLVALALWIVAVLTLLATGAFDLHWSGYVIGLTLMGIGLIVMQFGKLPRPIRRLTDWWPFY